MTQEKPTVLIEVKTDMNPKSKMPLTAGKLMLALITATLLFSGTALAQWKPEKPIEFVIMAGQGGGADRLARFIQAIIQKEHFSTQPFIPVNKGGGSGAEALRYLKEKSGDNHILMATLNSYYTTPLQNDIGVDIKEFTPVARLALDTFLLWVNEDSTIKSLPDYIKSVKDAKGNFKMGGTGRNQEDELITKMMEGEFKFELTYIPFSGGGDVAKNLVGGHVDSTVNNPSEASGFYRAKKVRALATFTEQRLPAYKDVPTMRELGHDLVYTMQRSVVGPPGMSKEAEAYYSDVFKKVSESKEWLDYVEKSELDAAYLAGNDLQKFFLKEREEHRKLLISMGAIKP